MGSSATHASILSFPSLAQTGRRSWAELQCIPRRATLYHHTSMESKKEGMWVTQTVSVCALSLDINNYFNTNYLMLIQTTRWLSLCCFKSCIYNFKNVWDKNPNSFRYPVTSKMSYLISNDPVIRIVCLQQAITHTTMLSLKLLRGDGNQVWHRCPHMHMSSSTHKYLAPGTPIVGAQIACTCCFHSLSVDCVNSCSEMLESDGTAERGAVESQEWALLTGREGLIEAFSVAAVSRYLNDASASVTHNSQNVTLNCCRLHMVKHSVNKCPLQSFQYAIYPKSPLSPLPSLKKTRGPFMITPFSLLPPLPSRKICITQLRIRAARRQITSALFLKLHAQTTNSATSKEQEMAQARLERLWLDQLLTTPTVHIRSERELSMIWRQNETSYLVNGNQEVRQEATWWAQTGITCHQFFNMQRMGREGRPMQTTFQKPLF